MKIPNKEIEVALNRLKKRLLKNKNIFSMVSYLL